METLAGAQFKICIQLFEEEGRSTPKVTLICLETWWTWHDFCDMFPWPERLYMDCTMKLSKIYSFYMFLSVFDCMYSHRVSIIFHLHLPSTWLNNLAFWLVMAVLMFSLSGFLNGKKGMRQQICKRRLISLRRVRQISPAKFALGNVLPNHKASGKYKFRLGYPCLNIGK